MLPPCRHGEPGTLQCVGCLAFYLILHRFAYTPYNAMDQQFFRILSRGYMQNKNIHNYCKKIAKCTHYEKRQ